MLHSLNSKVTQQYVPLFAFGYLIVTKTSLVSMGEDDSKKNGRLSTQIFKKNGRFQRKRPFNKIYVCLF
ncbi:MAG: hypothetical protein GY805_34315 [Chloroflexi bacterium]|nr:hypothetical protein [Chloroflexota bacterium]